MTRSPLRVLLLAAPLAGCAANKLVPAAGPATHAIAGSAERNAGLSVVDLTMQNVAATKDGQPTPSFANLPAGRLPNDRISQGQVLEITMWEAAPAVLLPSPGDLSATSRGAVLTLPPQEVSFDGTLNVPFVGRIAVADHTTSELETTIIRALHGKANHPQVLVRVSGQSAQKVTVIGDVVKSTRMDLSAKGEHLLDAIAAAGGPNTAVEKATVQVSRGEVSIALPLERVVRVPRENVALAAGDVITLYSQPKSFISMGAVSKPGEVNFEATGVTLAQALGRVGGAVDGRADPSGVFVFRVKDGRPTIYRVNLHDPSSMFVLRAFDMQDGDVLYVSNSPTADFQKLVSVIGAAVYPFDAARNITR